MDDAAELADYPPLSFRRGSPRRPPQVSNRESYPLLS